MNLVQINERLKEMPLQAVQQYANGMNPEIPPYLALGELQRRETMHKQAANAQGAASGPQPSVKEQIEQKAGLMALQQQQAQQAQQQMMQPRPGPVPANVPQPEDQPELAMASGGIARLPVRSDMFDFASGGIIAFNGKTDGSEVDSEEAKKKKLRHYTLQEQGADWVARKEAERAANPEVQEKIQTVRNLEAGIPELLAGTGAQGVKKPAMTLAPEPVVARKEEAPPPRLMDGRPNPAYIDFMSRNTPPVSSVYPDESKRGTAAGLPNIIRNNQNAAPANLNKTINSLPPATPAPSRIKKDTYKDTESLYEGVTPGVVKNLEDNRDEYISQYGKERYENVLRKAKEYVASKNANTNSIPGLNDPAFLDAAKRAIAEPKQEQGIADYKARMAAMGLGEPYGKDQEARISDLNAQYQKGLENRGLERLMRVLQARNMGEYGSRYLGAVEQERAADLAQAAKMNELLSSLEGKRREEGMTGVKTIGEEMDRRRQLAGQTAASLGGSQMQAGVSRANQLSQNATSLKIAELDRKLRERLHNTPAAQRLSVEEQAIKDYVDAGLTRTQAFEKVKTVGASGDKQNLAELKALQSSLKERALTDKDAAKLLRDVEAKIAAMAGVGGSATLPAGFKLD